MADMKYLVEEYVDIKENGSRKLTWRVKCPDGSIANGYHHPTKESAEKHAHVCNAFCIPWIIEQQNELKKMENM